jgi:hypothetical protein
MISVSIPFMISDIMGLYRKAEGCYRAPLLSPKRATYLTKAQARATNARAGCRGRVRPDLNAPLLPQTLATARLRYRSEAFKSGRLDFVPMPPAPKNRLVGHGRKRRPTASPRNWLMQNLRLTTATSMPPDTSGHIEAEQERIDGRSVCR